MEEEPSQQPPSDIPTTNKEEEEDSLQNKIQKFLLTEPLLSLLVGGTLLVIEVTAIILLLVSPTMVGISDENALTETQRTVLGVVTIIMLVEAMAFGSIDIGTNRQRAQLIKAQRQYLIKQLNNLKENAKEATDSARSHLSHPLHSGLIREILREQIVASERMRHRLRFIPISEAISKTRKELKELYQELNNHTLRYMASLVFDLAAFLWKWALTLLVISNNWVSVGVAIGGGVVLPALTFWQKAIHPTA